MQLLPMSEYWEHTNQSLEVYGAHTPWQIILDYTSKDILRPDAFSVLPAREEYYAYIGLTPFIALILLPLAFHRRNRQPLVFLALVLVFVVLWIDLDQMPWREAFLRTRFLTQFRHLLRPLVFGSFVLILLAAFGLDTAIRRLWRMARRPLLRWSGGRPPIAPGWFLSAASRLPDSSDQGRAFPVGAVFGGLLLTLLVAAMFASVGDLFTTHQPYLSVQPVSKAAYELTAWLRQADPSDYRVRGEPTTYWHDALFSNHLRMLDAWYPLPDLYLFAYTPGQQRITAQPKYVLQSGDAPLPAYPDLTLVNQIGPHSLYALPHSLPLVFAVNLQTLYQDEETDLLQAKEVKAVAWEFSDPNSLAVQAVGQGGDILVLLIPHTQGWQVSIDGRVQPAANVQGFLGVQMLSGAHHYVFRYHAASFSTGLAISLAALGLAGFFVIKNPALKGRSSASLSAL